MNIRNTIAICLAGIVSALTGFGQTPALEWAKSMGASDSFSGEFSYAIATDVLGNVYTIGTFSGTADFDPGAGVFNLTAMGTLGGEDIFILKLDADGDFVWAKTIGSTSYDRGSAITVDGAGNVYTTGYFSGVADFDPGAGVANLIPFSAGDSEVFISKLDTDGNFVWAKMLGGSPIDDDDFGMSIAVDGTGNVYTTGYFSDTEDFDPGPGTFSMSAIGGGFDEDVFVSKLDATGNFVWAKSFGSVEHDEARTLALDAFGNIYLTGIYRADADLDPGAGNFPVTFSGGGSDTFISKLDDDGNFIWGKKIGGISNEDSYSMAVDASGNAFIAGSFTGTIDFDPGPGTVNLTAPFLSLFVLRLDDEGDFIWAKAFADGVGINFVQGIALDQSGSVYTTGSFGDTADFDPGAGTFNMTTPEDANDVFVSKLDPSGNFVWAARMGSDGFEWGHGIDIDDDDNIYITGEFDADADFDPTACVFNIPVNGPNELFVTKLTQNTTAPFTITGFSPASGLAGTPVTINGTNFSVTPPDNVVKFNTTTATVNGSTPTTITTAVPAGATTGKISVTIGCTTVTSADEFTIGGGSLVTFTTQPDNVAVCEGGDATFSVVATGDTNLQYQWQQNGTNLTASSTYTGVTSATMTVNNASLALDGSEFRCVVRGDNTSDTSSETATLTVGIPDDAEIIANGTILTATAGDNYQWFRNGNELAGETSQTYKYSVLAYGAYTVNVTSDGCTSSSNEFVYLITGTEQQFVSLSVSPNPFTNELRIDAPEDIEVGLIVDVTGKEVKRFERVNQTLQVGDLPAGIYFIRVSVNGHRTVKKLIKR